ncbi:MAG: DUF4435 domain-containing protein [Muribaculaceae bacterium]|nr:DUF4435 domain-containing protein [Muribaculaceae bacterium]
MEISLPPRLGAAAATPSLPTGESIVIIGANGAGKTRFTRAIADTLGSAAYRMSALEALYGRDAEGRSPLDELLGRLMHDEMLNLISYKLAVADGKDARLRPTRLDKVVALWQGIFPGNRMLIDSGRILFARGLDALAPSPSDTYSAIRLSDGERAVLYYISSVLYAPHGAIVFVDSPELFLHPTLISSLWNRIEETRPDCTFCYTTHDPEFTGSRNGARIIWVRDFDPAAEAWDYDLMPPHSGLPPELYMALVGARKPVLFIEGDSEHSIDAKLYPLIFPDHTVRSLGSCNKVIEAVRTFNDLSAFHKLDSTGIVDRDRRDEGEVEYLRDKRIMVPDVAEIENMLILEDIVRTMAEVGGHDPERAFWRLRRTIVALFRADINEQAMLHTRHRVKRTMEYRVDARCRDIATLERHLRELPGEINPRGLFEVFRAEFTRYYDEGDYASILRVYNRKSMLISGNVAQLCGFRNKDRYIEGIIRTLRRGGAPAERIRAAVRRILRADTPKPGANG